MLHCVTSIFPLFVSAYPVTVTALADVKHTAELLYIGIGAAFAIRLICFFIK